MPEPTVVLTALLVIITGFYAWVTYRISKANAAAVAEMQRQTEGLFRPQISVRALIPPGYHVVMLKIENVGKTAAAGVRLELDRDFYIMESRSEEGNLRRHKAFQELIPCFPPGFELTFHLVPASRSFSQNPTPELTPSVFSVRASYSFFGKLVEETTVIDLSVFEFSAYPYDPVQKELARIGKALEELVKRMK